MNKKISFKIILLLSISISIFAKEYHVKKSDKNIIKFISDAPIEDFEGVTDNIDGYLFYEKDLTNESQLYFEVDLRTLDTGIGLRNRHMRENYLETEQYPMAAYTGKITKAEKLEENQFEVQVSGEMNIHGISIPQIIEGRIIINDWGIRVITNFIVKLSDHKIEIPSLMFMKIDENMDLQLDFNLEEAK
ncbi:MAG: YceI family protein [Ignavibacteriae bacterium]|nr:YceI family protein [Ignavibacteriota bacterium]MCB0748283.1 YceI family protein [Ignavibacteriota bacterium]